MRKLFCFLLINFYCLAIFLPINLKQVNAENKQIYLLGNAEVNQVLQQNNMYKKTSIASLTKLMTAYICFNKIFNCELCFNDQVLVSQKASEAEPSKAYLIQGESYDLEELLKVMLIKSANDSAIAIAEHISGTENDFADLMNRTAIELGMKSTNYTNASGLSTPNQYSTAYDQYLLFQKILEIDEIVEILKTPSIEFNNKQETKIFYSTNKLIGKNIIGKTGYTIEAQNCFCGCNFSSDLKFIYITLGNETSQERFDNVINSLNSAQQQYQKQTLLSTHQFSKKIALGQELLVCKNAEEFSIFVEKGNENKYNVIQNFYKLSSFPIHKGDKVGENLIILNNKIVKKIDIIAQNNVKRISIFSNIKRIILA